MEKNLKKTLTEFLNDFDAKEINEYFANGFDDDWDEFYSKENVDEVLEFLNEKFWDIDVDYRDTKYFEKMVRETLEEALKMLD